MPKARRYVRDREGQFAKVPGSKTATKIKLKPNAGDGGHNARRREAGKAHLKARIAVSNHQAYAEKVDAKGSKATPQERANRAKTAVNLPKAESKLAEKRAASTRLSQKARTPSKPSPAAKDPAKKAAAKAVPQGRKARLESRARISKVDAAERMFGTGSDKHEAAKKLFGGYNSSDRANGKARGTDSVSVPRAPELPKRAPRATAAERKAMIAKRDAGFNPLEPQPGLSRGRRKQGGDPLEGRTQHASYDPDLSVAENNRRAAKAAQVAPKKVPRQTATAEENNISQNFGTYHGDLRSLAKQLNREDIFDRDVKGEGGMEKIDTSTTKGKATAIRDAIGGLQHYINEDAGHHGKSANNDRMQRTLDSLTVALRSKRARKSR